MNETLGDVNSVAAVIQVALTPVFLLSGVATLLNVLSTRLGRVADRVDSISERHAAANERERRELIVLLAYLRRRSLILDVAVMLAVLAGAATCVSALILFLGSLRDRVVGLGLFITFGLALVLTVGALGCYLFEVLLASRGIRVRVRDADEEVEDAPRP